MPSQILNFIKARPPTATGDLLHVQRGSPNVTARRRDREEFARAYAEAVSRFPQVREVRVRDNVSYLDVFTLYAGDIQPVEDSIYEIEASMMDRFPGVQVDWYILRQDRSTAEAGGTDAQVPTGR